MRKKETDRFLEVESLMCRQFYDFYRENRTQVARGINQQMLFEKAVGGLLQTLNMIIQETEGGIHIRDLGYFCHVKKLNKKQVPKKSILAKTEYKDMYSDWFFPEQAYEGWYLYTGDVYDVNKRLDKYNLHFDIIKSKYELMAFGTGLSKAGKDARY